jgi:hypothetical protein
VLKMRAGFAAPFIPRTVRRGKRMSHYTNY